MFDVKQPQGFKDWNLLEYLGFPFRPLFLTPSIHVPIPFSPEHDSGFYQVSVCALLVSIVDDLISSVRVYHSTKNTKPSVKHWVHWREKNPLSRHPTAPWSAGASIFTQCITGRPPWFFAGKSRHFGHPTVGLFWIGAFYWTAMIGNRKLCLVHFTFEGRPLRTGNINLLHLLHHTNNLGRIL